MVNRIVSETRGKSLTLVVVVMVVVVVAMMINLFNPFSSQNVMVQL
jgi:hypothetical protein